MDSKALKISNEGNKHSNNGASLETDGCRLFLLLCCGFAILGINFGFMSTIVATNGTPKVLYTSLGPRHTLRPCLSDKQDSYGLTSHFSSGLYSKTRRNPENMQFSSPIFSFRRVDVLHGICRDLVFVSSN